MKAPRGAHVAGTIALLTGFSFMFIAYTIDNGFDFRGIIGLTIVAIVVLPSAYFFTEWLAAHPWGPYKRLPRSDDDKV
jgi:hypothetical protein